MKKLYLLFILFGICNATAQITSVTPNHTKRGVILSTTITPYSNSMAISSGQGSMYRFSLEQGSNVINGASYYTYTSSGLGWGTAFYETFNIPVTATPGFYDLHVTSTYPNPYYNLHYVYTNAVQILETMIAGKVFFDANQNGVLDTNEYGISNQNIVINPGNNSIYSGTGGAYFSNLDIGTYNVSPVLPAGWSLTTPSLTNITVPPDTFGNDIGLYTPPSTLLSHEFYTTGGPFRCFGFNDIVLTALSNSNNNQQGTITLLLDTALTYISSSPSPSDSGIGFLKWDYSLNPFQSFTSHVLVSGGTPGNSVNLFAYDSLYDGSGNFDSLITDTIANRVICSLDPNDMTASPFGSDSTYHYVPIDQKMVYKIRFQNCGTDTAFNIFILNWIDPDLDMNTFHQIYSSHPASVQLESNRTFRYIFNNIMLPDSNVDEPNSHGMFVYTISPYSNIPNNTVVTNDAYIYFDNNPAIVTNLVWNYFISPTTEIKQIESKDVLINPMPIQDYSLLVLPDDKQYRLIIYDISGRLIMEENVSGTYILNSGYFKPGIFFYKLQNNSATVYSGKFVVIH